MRVSHLVGASVVALGMSLSNSALACYVYSGVLHCDGELPNVNAKPNEATAPTLARTAVTSQTALVGSHLQSAFSSRSGGNRVAMGETGVSAGDTSGKYGLWFSGAAAITESTEVFNEFDGTSRTGTLGFDVRPSNNLVVGVSVFAENATLDTFYNLGKVERDGYSVVPYVAYDLGQGTTVDALVGVTYLTGEISRANNFAKGDFDGYRAMTSLNAHHNYVVGAVLLRGDVGYTYAHEKQGSYTETATNAHIGDKTTNLAQGKIGGRVGYGFDTVEPYAQAHYVRDFVRNSLSGVGGLSGEPSNDRDEVLTAIGLDWYPTATESVGVEVSHGFFRSNESTTTVIMNGRLTF